MQEVFPWSWVTGKILAVISFTYSVTANFSILFLSQSKIIFNTCNDDKMRLFTYEKTVLIISNVSVYKRKNCTTDKLNMCCVGCVSEMLYVDMILHKFELENQ